VLNTDTPVYKHILFSIFVNQYDSYRQLNELRTIGIAMGWNITELPKQFISKTNETSMN